MFESLFSGAAATTASAPPSIIPFVSCIVAALGLGLALSFVYCFRHRHTQSFVMTLALLPAIVCIVIAMVNGSVGAGVAVAGAFSLVRFRSVPGSARDICYLFLAMCVGLVAGMGYVGYAALTTLILGTSCLLYQAVGLGAADGSRARTLRITVPEDLDFTTLFDDVLDAYTTSCELVDVKTTTMGSLYRLTYDVVLREADRERVLIDALRCRNGNLEISISRQEGAHEAL